MARAQEISKADPIDRKLFSIDGVPDEGPGDSQMKDIKDALRALRKSTDSLESNLGERLDRLEHFLHSTLKSPDLTEANEQTHLLLICLLIGQPQN